jgi:hypothetical protein
VSLILKHAGVGDDAEYIALLFAQRTQEKAVQAMAWQVVRRGRRLTKEAQRRPAGPSPLD